MRFAKKPRRNAVIKKKTSRITGIITALQSFMDKTRWPQTSSSPFQEALPYACAELKEACGKHLMDHDGSVYLCLQNVLDSTAKHFRLSKDFACNMKCMRSRVFWNSTDPCGLLHRSAIPTRASLDPALEEWETTLTGRWKEAGFHHQRRKAGQILNQIRRARQVLKIFNLLLYYCSNLLNMIFLILFTTPGFV